MPNIWTHILFAEEVAETVGYSLSSEDKNAFRLGAQGPDPFFYHNFWPWLKEKPVTAMGHSLHYRMCGPFLLDLIDYAKNSSDNKLRAYVLGFVTHHLLDRNAHPYIIYRSGNEGSKHTRLETIIDTLMLKRTRGVDTWKSPVYKQVTVGPSLYSPIGKMLSVLIGKHYPNETAKMPSGFIETSYRQMLQALRLLYDPYGWKNRLFKDLVASYSHKPVTDGVDYLNLEGTEWFHPTNINESSNASFIELYDNGQNEGEKLLPLILHYWSQPDNDRLEEIRLIIGNKSYDTGKDCELGLKNVFFDPIL